MFVLVFHDRRLRAAIVVLQGDGSIVLASFLCIRTRRQYVLVIVIESPLDIHGARTATGRCTLECLINNDPRRLNMHLTLYHVPPAPPYPLATTSAPP